MKESIGPYKTNKNIREYVQYINIETIDEICC